MCLKFSLVLATINRTEELIRFLRSLIAQSYQKFEVIVIDQNPDNRLITVLEPFTNQIILKHIRSEKGLSRARNVGLKHISGDVVAFPDDDCWYPPTLLTTIFQYFNKYPEISGFTGRSANENGVTSAGRWAKKAGLITKTDVWIKGISFTIFLNKSVIEKVGNFDESLGVGSGTPWGSGEETDYLIRTLKSGFKLYYDPDIIVHHPEPIIIYDKKTIERVRNYGGGMGRVLRKQKSPLWHSFYLIVVRPMGGILKSLLSLNFLQTKYYLTILSGRIKGWLK